jgi:chitinase
VSQVTHINYAFADIGDDLKIVMGDPAVDPANFLALKALKKKNPALKTMISVGGWTWSGKFSDVALTDESRTIFADSVVAFIKQYGFDGVDIDWEYPRGGGLSTNISRFSDKGNFTLLMAKLREKLDAQGALDGTHYLLSFAGGSNPTYTINTELNKLARYVDYAAIMTYDIHGTADRYTDFNAPLYLPRESSPQTELSVNAAVKAWLAKGFPSSKMVMGVPFYGYIYTDVKDGKDGLFQRFADCSSIPYEEIKSRYSEDSSYVRRYHEDARVPWLFDGTTFISYDDPESIAEKSAYIKSNRILGAAVWDLSQDSQDELLDTLYGTLK